MNRPEMSDAEFEQWAERWSKNGSYKSLAMHLRQLVKEWHEAELDPAQFLAAASLAWTNEYEAISRAKVVTGAK